MTDVLSIRRRLIGSSLRRYRESLGYNLAVPARILECDRSKISRIETGQRGIRPKELRELLTEYGVDVAAQDVLNTIARRPSDARRRYDHDHVLGSAYLEFLEVEKSASAIFIYAPVQVPRLLQTPDYLRAIIAADPDIPEQARTALAAAEITRQRVMLHDRRTNLTVVIGEAALRQQVAPAEVTRAQLLHLADLNASCPEVSIRIQPFTAAEHASSGTGFSVLQFSELPLLGLVHIDGPAGGIWLDTPAAVAAYTTTFTRVQRSSLTQQGSVATLSKGSRMREASVMTSTGTPTPAPDTC